MGPRRLRARPSRRRSSCRCSPVSSSCRSTPRPRRRRLPCASAPSSTSPATSPRSTRHHWTGRVSRWSASTRTAGCSAGASSSWSATARPAKNDDFGAPPPASSPPASAQSSACPTPTRYWPPRNRAARAGVPFVTSGATLHHACHRAGPELVVPRLLQQQHPGGRQRPVCERPLGRAPPPCSTTRTWTTRACWRSTSRGPCARRAAASLSRQTTKAPPTPCGASSEATVGRTAGVDGEGASDQLAGQVKTLATTLRAASRPASQAACRQTGESSGGAAPSSERRRDRRRIGRQLGRCVEREGDGQGEPGSDRRRALRCRHRGCAAHRPRPARGRYRQPIMGGDSFDSAALISAAEKSGGKVYYTTHWRRRHGTRRATPCGGFAAAFRGAT